MRSTPTREACASARAPGRRPSQGTSCSSYWRLAGARTARTGEKRPANRHVFESLAIARAVRPLEGSNRSPSASPRNRLPTGIAAGGVYPRPVTSPRTVLERARERLAHVGADPADDADTRQRKAFLVLISVLILPIAVVWGVLYLALGSPVGYVPLAYSLVLLGAIGVFARTRGVAFWGILAPMGALVFGGVRASVRWYAAFVAVFVACGIAGERVSSISSLPAWFTSTMLGLNVIAAGTIVFTLLALFAQQRHDALVALRSAQERTENLLLDILPHSIAERLKSRPQTIADHFPTASILFADVVDFTPRAEHLPPAEVVGMLDDLFGHFDTLAERHGLEKIKTIGDCYMVAAGVPNPRPDHARALALMAFDMLEAVDSKEGVGHLGLELRVGINSGPVVAGVIGRKRFLYDLWGDAVNTASRMEAHGASGR